MDIDSYFEKIEAYLGNALSDIERTSFEREMKSNPILKKRVLSHVLANEALGLTIEDRVAGKLNTLAEARTVSTPKKSLKVWWKQPLTIAAGVLLLITTGMILFANQNYSNPRLASDFAVESTIPITRSDTKLDENLAQGIQYFTTGAYDKSINALTKVGDNSLYASEANYLLAYAHMKQADLARAKFTFERLLANKNLPPTIDSAEIEWNLLLIQLKQYGTNETFNQQLNAILNNPAHGYYQKAQALSQRLQSVWRNFTFN